MPIFADEHPVPPTAPLPTQPTQPPIINTASLYRNFQFLPTIIGFLDGTPWSCTFYHQWLGEDDVIINSQDVYDPTLKQYVKINNFEVRVTTTLTNNFDIETNTNTITGVANVYPFITPIVGDVFVATVQDTNLGVFEVTKAERLSLYKESAWSIEYTMIMYVVEHTLENLDQFVIAELMFNAENIEYGSNPLHSKSEYDLILSTKEQSKQLIEYYYSQFFDRRIKSFLVPFELEQTTMLYDSYLVSFWNKVIQPLSSLDYEHPIEYTLQYSRAFYEFYTVWDAIVEQSVSKLATVVKYLNVFSVTHFDALYQRHNVRLTEISDVLFPDLTLGKPQTALLDVNQEQSYFLSGPYIFSREFYTQTTITIPIELITTKVLKKQPINYPEVKAIDDTLLTLTPIQQFYYIPLLLTFYSLVR